MNKYTKLQKIIANILIFSLLFSSSVNISFFSFVQKIFAQDDTKYDLVSIFVQDDIYSDIKDIVDRYARDISGVLQNTKTIIIPTKKSQNPADIVALNEKLFFEWYSWLNWLSWDTKLIWSVFIWDLPIPVVENKWSYEKTIFPYVDLDNKLYIYNKQTKLFSLNTNISTDPKAEIWHWFISPNTWDKNKDIQEITNYFDKNHDFYTWEGNFKQSNWIINLKKSEDLNPKYEPFVFYYDQNRESTALNLANYKWYKAYLDNIEDISYNRFSTYLTDKLKSVLKDSQSSHMSDLASAFPWEDFSKYNTDISTQNVPDVQSRHIINNITKKFIQIFNGSTIWEFRKDVHNAWRYNSWSSDVWVDLIPWLITSIDTVSQSIIKDVNTDLENKIDEIVANWLSRDIAIPTTMQIQTNATCWETEYTNILNWKLASDIKEASECTIYRWTTKDNWNLVEANRWFNIKNIQSDLAICNRADSKWYWGWNSALNLDRDQMSSWKMVLWARDNKKSITPLLDIKWSNKSTDTNKIPSPLDCYKNNFLVSYEYWEVWMWEASYCWIVYSLPINWKTAVNWWCWTENTLYNEPTWFDEFYKTFNKNNNTCVISKINLDKKDVKTSNYYCRTYWDNDETPIYKNYNFTKIKSYIKHKSPTSSELKDQVQNMITPSLPIDKDRYIDFIWANNTYAKINYPYLFRLNINDENIDLDITKNRLKTFLDEKSKEINDLINSKNPSSLTWPDLEIYNLLKNWNYPSSDIDLYNYLKNKETKNIDVLWNSKSINYLDTLIFSIYWNNLPSVSAKYKFIFENYLSDQFGWNNYNFYLPKNKKQYETAYLWASWDPVSMYIKMDPEDKDENPYAQLMADNQDINNKLISIKNETKSNSNSMCAPPEWVPIFKWFWAITCRLKTILPPKIKISDWYCWTSLNWNWDNYPQIDNDWNWLNDYLEESIKKWTVILKSDSSKYYYNKTWKLDFSLLDENWNVISYDTLSKVKFELIKVTVSKDTNKDLSEMNKKVIYDNTIPEVITQLNSKSALEETKKYVNFKDVEINISAWKANYWFTTKSLDADLVFRATSRLKDLKLKNIEKSTTFEVSVRWDLFYSNSYKLSTQLEQLTLDSWVSSIKVSETPNLFISDEDSFNSKKTNLESLNSLSSSKEKLFLPLFNYTKNWSKRDLAFPIKVSIKKSDWTNYVEPIILKDKNSINLKSIASFKETWSYKIEIKDNYDFKIIKDIEVFADEAVEIEPNVSTNLIEKWWVITTNVFTIFDKYKNPTIWDIYDVEVAINWSSVTFDDNSTIQKYQVIEWYRPFRLKSTNNSWTSNITFKLKRGEATIDSKVIKIDVVDKIEFDVIWDFSKVEVWENIYKYELKIKKQNEITNFNARAYLIANDMYLESLDPFVDIKNNFWSWSFKTKTKASEKVQLEFKIEWLKNSIYKDIQIFPWIPMKVDLSLSKSKIEASTSSKAYIYAELKDRYWNPVWTDNSSDFNLEIKDKYKKVITASSYTQKSVKWKATFTLNGMSNPWTWFFKVKVTPSLENNKIKINDKLTISWISENAWKIETFYFWNKQKLIWKKYNSIYTTLFWSNYADLTVKDNLANSIIFEKENRALVVSSLLSSTNASKDIFSLTNDWNIVFKDLKTDLAQDIKSIFNIWDIWNMTITFVNNTFHQLVSKITLNFKKDNLDLIVCKENDISSCYSKNKTSIVLKSTDDQYKTLLTENLRLIDDVSWEKLIEITRDWKFITSPYLTFDIAKNDWKWLLLNLKVNSKNVWNLAINMVWTSFNIIRDESTIWAVINSQTKWWIIMYLEWRDYYYKTSFVWNSTSSWNWFTVSYADPFASSQSKNEFWDFFNYWYENSNSKKWLWWSESNKTLLSFSAWKSVWESTKDYQTFALINIWDPVVSLKHIPKKLPWTNQDRKFDATVWALLSNDSNNIAYNIFDYNNDKNTDVVILKNNKYVELLEWKWNNDFINRWNLIFLPDLWNNPVIQTWDFTWDWYSDVVLLNQKRVPILLDNKNKIFSRINLDLKLNWIISQILSDDMDLDWKTDLIILDDSWEINIFYWTDTPWKFTNLKVSTSLGLTLTTWSRNDWWALYYNWLYQLSSKNKSVKVDIKDVVSEEYRNNVINEWTDDSIDRLMFFETNYDWIWKTIWWSPENYNNYLNEWLTLSNKWYDGAPDTIDSWLWDIANYFTWTITTTSTNKKTTFIKSEYWVDTWLEVSKTFIDLNWWVLKWWDKISLNIKLTNISGWPLNNIAYLDKIIDPFTLSSNPDFKLTIWNKVINKENIIVKNSPSELYTILIDSYRENWQEQSIFLNNWESINLELKLDTQAFKFWYIETGKFDTTTDQKDITFKNKQENCWDEYTIYKSTAIRSYVKDFKEKSCSSDVPAELAKNNVDTNNNGIPDYIDTLSNTWNTTELTKYANDSINTINKDSDNDWLPDSEDMSPWFNGSIMDGLDKINQTVDDISAWVDTILQWLGCWFGWGWCISSPLNWALLAPGWDPTLFWMPIWDWLHVWEWLPVFATPTICPGPPYIWSWPPCAIFAWGILDGSPTGIWFSQYRVFVTPTITWAIWTAICFWPNTWAWSLPPWISPLVPWWNCIVAAMPLMWCKNDGSDWDIWAKWPPWADVINWNCWTVKWPVKQHYVWDISKDYLNYKKTWIKSPSLNDRIKETLTTVAKAPNKPRLPNGPLLSIWWNNSWEEASLSVDFQALKNWNFWDVLKLSMFRVSAFPDFLMDWVTRQLEEIANKLTDFPTLYIVLPDFSGIYDSWYKDFLKNIKDKYQEWAKVSESNKTELDKKIKPLKEKLSKLNCEWVENNLTCLWIQADIKKLELQKDYWELPQASWIKWVYQFLWSLPMLSITPQKVYISLPYIDSASINKAINNYKLTVKQRKDEIEKAKRNWSLDNYTCVASSTDPNNPCKVIENMQNLIISLDRNIEVLEDYKKMPEKIHNLLTVKERRLSQILCNIENLSKLLWWWIWDNWKIFKTWVELYILIKAILKSWQLLYDVFLWYDDACHECKNERRDLQYFIWKLISMIIPKIPVIQFPKWPDIYLDLHNIRVAINITIPEFEFSSRPILLPTLPNIYLPDAPNVNINLPSLPVLPTFEIPDLPDLPSLPTVILPNLPPAPKLPKLFASLEWVLNILKLVTKAMCILKSSPFVPEWRAADQIAFITERTWFLDIDFLDVSLPQFSYPFVDAIKVTTYVNLEVETDFLVELANQIALPINAFTNDIVWMFNIWFWDLDFRWLVPSDINVDIKLDWTVNNNLDAYKSNLKSDFNKQNKSTITLLDLAKLIWYSFVSLNKKIEKESKIELTNTEFKEHLIKELSNKDLQNDVNTQKIVSNFNNALNYSFTKEDKIINDLLKNNEEKFWEVLNILNEEKLKTIKLRDNLQDIINKKVEENPLISNNSTSEYNSRLSKYNLVTLEKAQNLLKPDSEIEEIKTTANELKTDIVSKIDNYKSKINSQKDSFSEKINSIWNKTLALNSNALAITTTPSLPSAWTCNLNEQTKYDYKGIYILEKYNFKKISYRLFDYLDELSGKEVTKESDFDNDWDLDMMYMVWNEVYLKQNYLQKSTLNNYYSWDPIYLNKNIYFKINEAQKYYSTINWFEESISDSNYLNINFLDPKDDELFNYRIEFYKTIDKFWDIFNNYSDSYIPKNTLWYIIDAFKDIDEVSKKPIKFEKQDYIERKNLAYINNIWSLNWLKLTTKEIKNLTDDINEKSKIIINAWTKVYSWNNEVKINYYNFTDTTWNIIVKSAIIDKFSNIEFNQDIVIVSLNNDAYIEWLNDVELKWIEILKYFNKPLLYWAKINYQESEVEVKPYISIKYYDWSEALIDFKKIKYYELYGLWETSDSYTIRTEMENSFYYAKIKPFRNNVYYSFSNTILLSPQNESDLTNPEINLPSIKVPVYQKQKIDITNYIYENSWVKNIKDIYIDFDLWMDSDLNWNNYDDKDFVLWNKSWNIQIEKIWNKSYVNVWIFEYLIDKKIRINIVDQNNNIWFSDIDFKIYAPDLAINSIIWNSIKWKIAEPIIKEPVSFYRIRWWNISKLYDKNWSWSTNSLDSWIFKFDLKNYWTWLIFNYKLNWVEPISLFKIDEYTWKLDISQATKTSNNLNVRVYSSNNSNNETAYPKIIITKDNTPIYYEYLSTPNVWKVQLVNKFEDIKTNWVYYQHLNLQDYESYEMPSWINNNYWDVFVYSKSDSSKKPLLSIFKDWRINVSDGFYLEYDSYWKYVVFNIKKSWIDIPVWKVMVIPEENYIIK